MAILTRIVHRNYNVKIISTISVFIVYVSLHFVNEAQFSKATLVLASLPVAVMPHVKRIYLSE